MVESNVNLPAIILLGGGSAFRDTCPVLVNSIIRKKDNRQVSVVIIDHDKADIKHLYDELSDNYGVEVRKVLLENTALRTGSLEKTIEILGLKGITAQSNPADCPPMIRALVRVWSMEIVNAVKDLLPTVNGALQGNVILCSPFSVTGPTSSVVGLEALLVVRKGLADWMAMAPNIHSGTITSIGFALVAPDPKTGASPYGLEHGRKVADFLSERMDQGEGPFQQCLLLDSSGLEVRQDLASYRQCAAETVATFLTAQPPNQIPATGPGKPFADAFEVHRYLPEGASYANLALIRAGCSPEDRESIGVLVNLCEGILETSLPRHLWDLESTPQLETTRRALLVAQERLTRLNNVSWSIGKNQRQRDAEISMAECRKNFAVAMRLLLEELGAKWQSRDFSLMWAMPRNPDYLPSSGPTLPPPDLAEMPPEQLQSFTSLLEKIMIHAIRPRRTERLKALQVRFIASERNHQFFPIRETLFNDSLLEGKQGTTVLKDETLDEHMMSYLFMWLPCSGHPTPRYCTFDSTPVVRPLPAGQQAWPDNNFPAYHTNASSPNGSGPESHDLVEG